MPKIPAITLACREISLIVAAISVAAVLSALAFEHLGGVHPCPLCLEERIAYYAAAPAGVLAFLLARPAPLLSRALLAAIAAGFIYNAGLGAYHSGIEWHWWAGPEECSGMRPIASSAQGLMQSLAKPGNVIRCDEASLRILGISLAGYNALLSAALAVLAGLGASGFAVSTWPPSAWVTRPRRTPSA